MSFRSLSLIPARVALVAVVSLSCGRGSSVPVVHVVTQATLDSLPSLAVDDGRQLCEADGRTACPLHSAVGNWLSDDRFAIWEPGRPIMAWGAGDSIATELTATDSALNTTILAVAVAPEGSGFQVVAAGISARLLHFERDGRLVKSETLPRMDGVAVRGFAGAIPLLYRLRETGPDQQVQFDLDALASPKDTSGRPLMRVALPTVKLVDGLPEPLPFFAPWPSFGLDPDGGIVWSAGDQFVLHRSDAGQAERWTINGAFPGPRITDADIAARRAEAAAAASLAGVTGGQLDSMAADVGQNLAAIAGIAVSRKGEILVIGPASPARDSVDYYRVTADGQLRDRFRLPRQSRVLVFAGDSLIVHRPTEGEPWEIRWLHLQPMH